jgi:hypothetical protein
MVIKITNTVATIIQALSPLLTVGAAASAQAAPEAHSHAVAVDKQKCVFFIANSYIGDA